ncbi:uncharacterized protein LOC141604994 isoform X1 [Silene latifolia]|uniref:uncharacterized protein LOC141604994 isoform X1 n=1 Tax=Silene latifolia TaxID=37657 RepID=UPI003D76DA4B
MDLQFARLVQKKADIFQNIRGTYEMGKRGKKRENNGVGASLSIREEASGKRQSHNPKSMLKLKHLQNLAVWATENAQAASLGAFFGHSFAEFGESLGVPPDPSLFSCQRCETILQPGFNCTIRIQKNKAKRKGRTKVMVSAQNNAVYTCHFCSHRNSKRGTPKGYVKEIAPSKAISSINGSVSSAIQRGIIMEKNSTSNATMDKADVTPLPAASNAIDFPVGSSASLTATTGVKLLDSKRKRKKPGPKKSGDEALVSSASDKLEKASGTSKRRKKSWTTLKEIAENEENERNKRFTNFSIPFVL